MLLSEQPTASLAYQAREYCGFRPGPTRVSHPSRMMGTSERQLLLALLHVEWLLSCLVVVVCCALRLVLQHTSSNDSALMRFRAISGQTLHPSACTQKHCTSSLLRFTLLLLEPHSSCLQFLTAHCTAQLSMDRRVWAVSHQSCTLTHRHPSSHLTWQ